MKRSLFFNVAQSRSRCSVAQHFLAIDTDRGLSISFEANICQLSLTSDEPIFNAGTGRVWLVKDTSRQIGTFEATETQLSVTCEPCDDLTVPGIINARSIDLCFTAIRPSSYGDATRRLVPLPFRTAVLSCKSAALISQAQSSFRSGAEELGLL